VTLKETPGAEIPHYTMVEAKGINQPVGSASDQIFSDLTMMASFLKDVEGVTVERIVGGVDINPDTGLITENKVITRIVFSAPYPVLQLQKIETGNNGRTVFKVVAYDPQPVPVPDTSNAETENVPEGMIMPDFGPQHELDVKKK
jgi:hypothetical protein